MNENKNDSAKNPFGVGEENFDNIIQTKSVYVDKTELIYNLVSDPFSHVPRFLARPRRFGKTLLLDTMQNVFEGNRQLFSGLAIENLMGDSWDAFPVIRISFNTIDLDPPAIFEASLLGAIKRAAQVNKIILDASSSTTALADLIQSLSLKYREDLLLSGKAPSILPWRNVVVLIDEYDFPLISSIGNDKDCENIRLALHKFYSAIKGCSKFLRFVFITGITKFRELSLFSAMNTTLDITLDSKFAKICGFTIDEIKKSFSEYLAPTLLELKKKGQLAPDASEEDLLKTLSDWYNGYTWDGNTEVLNPLSVLNFFSNKDIANYWYKTGSSLLTSRISQKDTDYLKLFSKDLSFNDSLPEMHINSLNDTVLLMQAGYLTVSGITKSGTTMQYHLKIPNNEIRESIRIELLARLLVPASERSNVIQSLNNKFLQFLDAFAARDEAKSEFFLSTIFAGHIQRGPGSPESVERAYSHIDPSIINESFFRSLLQLLLEFGNKIVTPESCSDTDRSDLAVQVTGNGWVAIEIKHEKADPDHEETDVSFSGETIVVGKRSEYVNSRLEKMISAAFVQIIKKNYAKKFLFDGVDVYAAAVAIYGTSDVTVRFKKVVWGEGENDTVELV
ncbi:MAG: AAA family ATPase [Deltaproteobacteria bacterium]|nr:AAA family ATPase [Deltaproteobacteria bacterium]